MASWIIGLLVGILVSGLVTWVTVRPAAEGGHEDGRAETVVLGRPSSWTWMPVVLTAGVLAVCVPRALTDPDPEYRVFVAWLMVIAVAVGMAMLIPARRRVLFSKEGIRVTGFPRLFMSWRDLDSIEVPEGSPIGIMRFKPKAGRKIPVDGTMTGWRALLKRLPDVCGAEARSTVLTALAKVPPPPDP